MSASSRIFLELQMREEQMGQAQSICFADFMFLESINSTLEDLEGMLNAYNNAKIEGIEGMQERQQLSIDDNNFSFHGLIEPQI